MPVSEQTYARVSLEDPEGNWELHRGRLQEKPGMSAEHNHLIDNLDHQLQVQLDREEFRVRINLGRLRRMDETYYIPDLVVLPAALVEGLRRANNTLEVYDAPMPLVVEVWSPSTGGYDVDGKLPEYQRRGDQEIWRLHPSERTLTAWRRQPDGTYEEGVYRGGRVEPVALPGVTIDPDALFA